MNEKERNEQSEAISFLLNLDWKERAKILEKVMIKIDEKEDEKQS